MIDDLARIHELAAVAWDRDGISDLVMLAPAGEAAVRTMSREVRVWTRARVPSLRALAYVGAAGATVPLAEFVLAPEPHWRITPYGRSLRP